MSIGSIGDHHPPDFHLPDDNNKFSTEDRGEGTDFVSLPGETDTILRQVQQDATDKMSKVRFADTEVAFLPEATAILYVHDNEIVHFWRRHLRGAFLTCSEVDETCTPVRQSESCKRPTQGHALAVFDTWQQPVMDNDDDTMLSAPHKEEVITACPSPSALLSTTTLDNPLRLPIPSIMDLYPD